MIETEQFLVAITLVLSVEKTHAECAEIIMARSKIAIIQARSTDKMFVEACAALIIAALSRVVITGA